ncbi:MAG: hypothetical protein WC004_03610 [Candidatus Absconditabacterales bacterium]
MNLLKIIACFLLSIAVLAGLHTWYNTFVSGSYWLNAPLYMTIGLGSVPIWIAVATFYVFRWIRRTNFSTLFMLLPLVLTIGSLQSCRDYAKSNQIVVYSEDCGSTWNKVNPGEAIPMAGINKCYMKEVMPGYNMNGDMTFYVLFKDKVKVKLYNSYDYEIFDPLLFMKEAKQLGKTNAPLDDPSYDSDRFEGPENRIIDIRIKKVESDYLVNEDVVNHDMNQLEEIFKTRINEELAARGVRLMNLEVYPDFEPQTKLAIDVANADRIYASKGLTEFGRQIAIARAGATQITIIGADGKVEGQATRKDDDD